MKEKERNKKIADLKWICLAFKNLYKILHLIKKLEKEYNKNNCIHNDEDIID